MKAGEIIKSILVSTKGSISSKRVCGVLGWFICVGVMVYCTIVDKQAPIVVDSVLLGSAAMLGVDSITGIWSNKDKNDDGKA